MKTPSEQCKEAGLRSLAELAKISSASTRTLINWRRDKPALFATVLAGAVVIKAANLEGKMKIDIEKLEKIAKEFKRDSEVYWESSCCIGMIDGVSFRLQVFSPEAAEERGDRVREEHECITA